MTTRETSFRESDHPGNVLSGENDHPGNDFPGKRLSRKKTIRESNHPGNDCEPYNTASKGIFRGSARNSAVRRKLWALSMTTVIHLDFAAGTFHNFVDKYILGTYCCNF